MNVLKVPSSPRSEDRLRLLKVLVLLVIAFVPGSIMLVLGQDAVLIALVALAAAAAFGVIFLRPARVLLVLIMLLPIYQLSLVILYRVSGSSRLISLVQPWKEVLLAGAVVLVLGHYALVDKRIKLRQMDWLLLVYFGWNLLYFLLPWGTSIITRAYGFRSLTMLCLIYAAGRLIPLTPGRQGQVLNILLFLGLLTGIAVVVDRFMLPTDWPVKIGLSEFLNRVAFANTGTVSYSGPLGLPWTFWTSTGQRRAAGFFANPLDLAASAHLTGIAALIVLLRARRKPSQQRLFATWAFLSVLLALLLSISRASIATFSVECLVIAIVLRRRPLLLSVLTCILIGGIVVMFSELATFVQETVTLQNPSYLGHLESWQAGLQVLVERPLGLGPGTSGNVGARTGNQVGGESQYIVTAVQLGIPGLILYVALQLLAIRNAFRLAARATGVTRSLALVTGVSRIGLAIIGLTANIEAYLFPVYLSWWLVGFVHQPRYFPQIAPETPIPRRAPDITAPLTTAARSV